MPYTGAIGFGPACYWVPDLQAAKKYYSDGFGVTTYFDEPTWVIFLVGEYEFWLQPHGAKPEFENHLAPYELTFWEVPDIYSAFQRFVDQGAVIHEPPGSDPISILAIVEDPWGNKIGLHTFQSVLGTRLRGRGED